MPPDVTGAAVLLDVTRNGLARDAAPGHRVRVMTGSIYRTGRGNATGTMANPRNPSHYPLTALCAICLGVLYRRNRKAGWRHTGRQAGQLLPQDEQVPSN